jgi:hypothetical protein
VKDGAELAGDLGFFVRTFGGFLVVVFGLFFAAFLASVLSPLDDGASDGEKR